MSGPGGVARALNSGTIGRFDDEVENIYSVIRRVCSYYKPVAIQRALRGLISGKRLFCLEVLERVSFKDKICSLKTGFSCPRFLTYPSSVEPDILASARASDRKTASPSVHNLSSPLFLNEVPVGILKKSAP